MKEQEAKSLVDTTFTTSYNEDKFRLFIRNLFSNYEECKEKASTGKYIPEAFQDSVVSYKRLFKFTDPESMEIDVLAVKLKNSRTLENARTMQRNFVARYLNGSRGGALKDAALVAFYTDDSDEWRFSLVRMDYVLDEEKNKVKKELTPARRFSFLVGGNEKTHTARRQLFPILTGDTETTLTELEQAFNIESVTKEFFEQYKELFLRLTESLDKVRKENPSVEAHLAVCNIETADFCKKLLGQIVFLYFLQKKGWLGVDKHEKWGTGDKNYLRSLLGKCINKGDDKFFDNYLEPLFYEALATERDGHYYSRFDCKIPFLNGGLFEPTNNYEWEQYDFNIPNELFSNNNITVQGDKGDGIFDIFDRYNFTVREDEALEKEVAVDPEMLGKVFENLLEVKDRKSKGAFYTPREIVHYMCQESLINYLDAKLNINEQEEYSVKVPKEDITDFIYHGDSFRENDATTKSKGKETSTYRYKLPETIRKNAKAIDKALADVKICDPAIGSGAFPVGIMHEIVRARLTLLESGLIRQTNKTNPYEYKRRAIQNSIYGVDIEESAIEIAKLRLWLSLVVDEEDMDEIKPLPNLTYKIVKGDSLLSIKVDLFNEHLLKEFEKLKDLHFSETRKRKKRSYESEIDKIVKTFDKKGQFDFRIFFSEVFRNNEGFDIVIGNPPYIQLQKDGGKLGKLYAKADFETFAKTGDIYSLFYEKGINLLRKHGNLCYITSNKWMRAGYGKKLRGFFTEYNPKILIDLGSGVFETATVDTNILLIERAKNENKLKAVTVSKQVKNLRQELDNNGVELSNLSDDVWFICSREEQALKEKIEKIGKPLKDWYVEIRRGVLTGLNEAFIIDNKTKEELCTKDPKSAEILKPLLRGRDIKKWTYDWQGLWLIATFPALNLNIDDYPAIRDYLLEFGKERLAQTGAKLPDGRKSRKRTGNKWFETQDQISYWKNFEQEKIVWASVGDNEYSAVNKGFYLLDTNYFASDLSLWQLAILNSKLIINLFVSKLDTLVGSAYRHYKYNFEKLPIPPITEENKDIVAKLENLTERITKIKQQDKSTNVKDLEQKIDSLVYKLYDLTPDEIQIIEETMK